jgi:hypothetical protein
LGGYAFAFFRSLFQLELVYGELEKENIVVVNIANVRTAYALL